MRHAVIMAGGSGTRLWPLSRGARPKQMLAVVGGKSLLRLAFERLVGVVDVSRIHVCTGAAYAEAVLAALPELTPAQVIGEPVARDTANAVALASAVIAAGDPDASIAFVTSDHVIEPVDGFQESMRAAFDVVDAMPEALVTFGIVPTSAHTGLGYIEIGDTLGSDGPLARARVVDSFTEKPDAATARGYVDSGRFWWNSGMFVWRADTVLAALAATLPESVRVLTSLAAEWDRPATQARLAEQFAGLRKISVDYAVLEPTSRGENQARVVVVPLSVDWLDVGSWPTLARILDTDVDGNSTAAATVLVDSSGNIVVSDDPDHVVATVGLTDTIVIHTKDVTMVCPKSQAERVKELVGQVEADLGKRFS
jgi:mannose-1-phosphate guanylyltransferase